MSSSPGPKGSSFMAAHPHHLSWLQVIMCIKPIWSALAAGHSHQHGSSQLSESQSNYSFVTCPQMLLSGHASSCCCSGEDSQSWASNAATPEANSDAEWLQPDSPSPSQQSLQHMQPTTSEHLPPAPAEECWTCPIDLPEPNEEAEKLVAGRHAALGGMRNPHEGLLY